MNTTFNSINDSVRTEPEELDAATLALITAAAGGFAKWQPMPAQEAKPADSSILFTPPRPDPDPSRGDSRIG